MDIRNVSAEDRFEAVVFGIFDRLGIDITIGTDFDEFKSYVEAARPDHPLGDPFDPDLHNMNNPGDACWIVGRDQDGEIMHLHALRVLPTGPHSAATYFRQNFKGFSPSECDVDFDRSKFRACPAVKRMRGRVAYSGEVWIGGKPGIYRGTGLISHLMRFAMLTAMRRLGADYMMGFVARPVAMKGTTLRFGYMHVDPLALRWYLKGQNEPLEGMLVYMGEEDMRYIMDLPVADLESLAA